MKILVYGAGNIGSLYAALLKESGADVSILARGRRLAIIREIGIQLENAATGVRTTTRLEAVEELQPGDGYDLVLVVLPQNHVSEVLPILAENRGTASCRWRLRTPRRVECDFRSAMRTDHRGPASWKLELNFIRPTEVDERRRSTGRSNRTSTCGADRDVRRERGESSCDPGNSRGER